VNREGINPPLNALENKDSKREEARLGGIRKEDNKSIGFIKKGATGMKRRSLSNKKGKVRGGGGQYRGREREKISFRARRYPQTRRKIGRVEVELQFSKGGDGGLRSGDQGRASERMRGGDGCEGLQRALIFGGREQGQGYPAT